MILNIQFDDFESMITYSILPFGILAQIYVFLMIGILGASDEINYMINLANIFTSSLVIFTTLALFRDGFRMKFLLFMNWVLILDFLGLAILNTIYSNRLAFFNFASLFLMILQAFLSYDKVSKSYEIEEDATVDEGAIIGRRILRYTFIIMTAGLIFGIAFVLQINSGITSAFKIAHFLSFATFIVSKLYRFYTGELDVVYLWLNSISSLLTTGALMISLNDSTAEYVWVFRILDACSLMTLIVGFLELRASEVIDEVKEKTKHYSKVSTFIQIVLEAYLIQSLISDLNTEGYSPLSWESKILTIKI